MKLKQYLFSISLLLLVSVVMLSFNSKRFALDGGTINNPYVAVNSGAQPPELTATNASGCTETLTYQWQQSFDNNNFSDVPGATGASFKPVLIVNVTHFRRKAICSSGDTAYTNNVATITIVQTSP